MEELQKQLVRIFGDTVTFAGGEGPGGGSGDSPESQKEEEVDIIQQMREKPATPLLR